MSLFITFEGPDGSGKSTQIQLLAEALRACEVPVIATREPGGTRIGNGVRALLLDPTHKEMGPRTEALLYCAARAQIVDEIIRPALATGTTVLCDRYGDSTLAYQGYGHGQDIVSVRRIVEFATGGLRPDLTYYLDIDVATGLSRKPAGELDRLEANALVFHERVRAGYDQLVRDDPNRWLVVDGSLSIDVIHAVVWERVRATLGL